MATKVQQAPQPNGLPKKPVAPRAAPVKKPAAARSTTAGAKSAAQQKARPVQKKAASVAGGEQGGEGLTSAYAIMANRIASRVAEMAESITLVEKSVDLGFAKTFNGARKANVRIGPNTLLLSSNNSRRRRRSRGSWR